MFKISNFSINVSVKEHFVKEKFLFELSTNWYPTNVNDLDSVYKNRVVVAQVQTRRFGPEKKLGYQRTSWTRLYGSFDKKYNTIIHLRDTITNESSAPPKFLGERKKCGKPEKSKI